MKAFCSPHSGGLSESWGKSNKSCKHTHTCWSPHTHVHTHSDDKVMSSFHLNTEIKSTFIGWLWPWWLCMVVKWLSHSDLSSLPAVCDHFPDSLTHNVVIFKHDQKRKHPAVRSKTLNPVIFLLFQIHELRLFILVNKPEMSLWGAFCRTGALSI